MSARSSCSEGRPARPSSRRPPRRFGPPPAWPPPAPTPAAPRAVRGFTLLEVEVALVILALAFLLLTKLCVAHAVLLGKTEEWLAGDPVLYVVPREDELERLLFHAPDLLAEDPLPDTGPGGGPPGGGPPGGGPPGGGPPGAGPAHAVTILSVSRQLVPPRITVLVDWEP